MFRKQITRIATTLLASSMILTQISPVAAQEPIHPDQSNETEMAPAVTISTNDQEPVGAASAKNEVQETEKKVPVATDNADAQDAKYFSFLPMVSADNGNMSATDVTVDPAAVDAYWRTIKWETFEGIFPNAGWRAFDCNGSTGGYQYWDDTGYKAFAGSWSAWPARGGTNAQDPRYSYYPNYACSWMIYGPFSLQYAQNSLLSFQLWNQSESSYDPLFYGVSCDGTNFNGYFNSGDTGGWVSRSMNLNQCRGDASVWIGFKFSSDGSIVRQGPFVDNVHVQEYR